MSPAVLATARVFFTLLAAVGLWLTYVGWFSKPTVAADSDRSSSSAPGSQH